MYRSEEDYLKTIYELTVESKRSQVKNVEIAHQLGHSDQSVNEKIRKLEAKEYVVFEPYRGVSLTEKGLQEAIRMVRAHRLWEVFLFQELEFSWSDLHQDAEELEHASSERVVTKLYHYLNAPDYCYHGNPIPDLDGQVKAMAWRGLASLEVGEVFVLNRVLDQKELLEFLDERNLKIGSKLTVLEKNEFASLITVASKKDTISIPTTIASMIFTF